MVTTAGFLRSNPTYGEPSGTTALCDEADFRLATTRYGLVAQGLTARGMTM